MSLRVKKFNWTKEEQKAIGVPRRTYAIMRGSSIVRGSFKSKAEASKKLAMLKKYS
jgi:hypothetical protein